MAHEDFNQLGFAARMLVWATRKRLHLLAGGPDDSHVGDVFRLGKLESLYEALGAIVDVLVCGPAHRIQLHGVSCPCLAPHEIGLIDTLAHLQKAQGERAFACLSSFMGGPAARLLWPAIHAVAAELEKRNLRIALIGECVGPPDARRQPVDHTVH